LAAEGGVGSYLMMAQELVTAVGEGVKLVGS
jgi:TPP-dependent trihydroxycyclohexane-1,2-dione (THcHDO) dehydratase